MYVPLPVPDKAELLPQYLKQEVLNISRAMSEAQPFLRLAMQYQEPKKLADGMIVLADGTSWNPGSGGGFYGYRAGAWRFLG